MPETLRARDNPRLRLARALLTRKGRRKHNAFLLEGPKPLHDLMTHRAEDVLEVLVREGEEAPAGVKRWVWVERGLWGELAGTESPQGVVAVVRTRWGAWRGGGGSVVCAGVQDPGNLGTILRTARFFGFSRAVVLSGTQDPFAPKVVRASAGAVTSPGFVCRAESAREVLGGLREDGVEVVALVAHGGEALGGGEWSRNTAWVVGAEGPGVAAEVEALATRRVTIEAGDPQAESLNVGVAFAVAAHAWSVGVRDRR